MKKLGIYIHVPFCVKKCSYCDFLSFPGSDTELREEYRDAMRNEINWWAKAYGKEQYRDPKYDCGEAYEVDTVFVGGGTPSLWEAWFLWQIALDVKEKFNCSDKLEFTCEANPGTIDLDKLSIWGVFGVNRLSFGVQSFDDTLLKTMGRIHTAEQAEDIVKKARKYFYKNINLDLMFGIPGQTLEQWRSTLEKAIALGPDHISFYSLQLEEGTPFFSDVQSGKLKPVSDDLDREMYHLAVKMLKDAGYHHYEISNAAKPGFESLHNLKYWNMDEYLGLGLGSSSYMKSSVRILGREEDDDPAGNAPLYGMRWKNTEDLQKYLSGDDPIEDVYVNQQEDAVSEYLFTGLRKIDGISLAEFAEVTGISLRDAKTMEGDSIWSAVEKHVKDGLLALEGDTLRFTEKGLDLANTVLVDFV